MPHVCFSYRPALLSEMEDKEEELVNIQNHCELSNRESSQYKKEVRFLQSEREVGE